LVRTGNQPGLFGLIVATRENPIRSQTIGGPGDAEIGLLFGFREINESGSIRRILP
jgi:hypothetical protein